MVGFNKRVKKAMFLLRKSKLTYKNCIYFYKQDFRLLCLVFRYIIDNRCKKFLRNVLRIVLFGLAFFFFSKDKFYKHKLKKSFYLRDFFLFFDNIKKRSLTIGDNKGLFSIQRKFFYQHYNFDKKIMEFKKEDNKKSKNFERFDFKGRQDRNFYNENKNWNDNNSWKWDEKSFGENRPEAKMLKDILARFKEKGEYGFVDRSKEGFYNKNKNWNWNKNKNWNWKKQDNILASINRPFDRDFSLSSGLFEFFSKENFKFHNEDNKDEILSFDEFVEFRKTFGNYRLGSEPSESLLNDFNKLKWRKRVSRFKAAFKRFKWRASKNLFFFNLEFILSFFIYLLNRPNISSKFINLDLDKNIKFESKAQNRFFVKKFKEKVLKEKRLKEKKLKEPLKREKVNDLVLHDRAAAKILFSMMGSFDVDYNFFWIIVTWKKFLNYFHVFYFNQWIRTFYLAKLASGEIDFLASLGEEYSFDNYPLPIIDYSFDILLKEVRCYGDIWLFNMQTLSPLKNQRNYMLENGKFYTNYVLDSRALKKKKDNDLDSYVFRRQLKGKFPELFKVSHKRWHKNKKNFGYKKSFGYKKDFSYRKNFRYRNRF